MATSDAGAPGQDLDRRRRRRGTTAAERCLQVAFAQEGRHLRRATCLAASAYVLLALLAYWPVSPLSNSSAPVCGCYDASLLTWSLGWTPFAILHGLNPLFTNYVDYPVGANMATNTLMPLLGVLGAPVTWLLGPLATFNLLLRASFAASAIAMFVTLRRFVASQPAAFVGGLMYAFSPYMTAEGSLHLDLAFVPLPPLILGALHDLFVAPRRAPLRAGAKLGLLCAAQFFIAQELVLDMMWLVAVGVVLLVLSRPVDFFRFATYKLRALAAALAVFVPICAYPAWFEIYGRGHLGSDQPFGALPTRGIDLLTPLVPTVAELLAPGRLAAYGSSLAGGDLYDNGGYLGPSLIVVLVVTVIVLFRDPLVRFCAAMLCAAMVLALGGQLMVNGHFTGIFLPLNLVSGLPLLSSEWAERFAEFYQLFAAILMAVALDRITRISVARRRVSLPLWWCWRRLADIGRALAHLGRSLGLPALARAPRLRQAARRSRLQRLGGGAGLERLGTAPAAAFAACTLFALLPLVPRLPIPEVPATVPTAFLDSSLAAQIAPGSVVLTYPYNEPPQETEALMWAAANGYRWRLIGGYFAWPRPDDGGDPFPPPDLQPLTMHTLLDAGVSSSPQHAPPYDRATLASLRLYVRRWRVDAIVVQGGAGDWQLIVRYLGAAFGSPQLGDGMYVWLDPRHSRPVALARESVARPASLFR